MNELFQRLELTEPLNASFAWSGCPAIEACLHELDAGKALPLCRACSRAYAKRAKLRAAAASEAEPPELAEWQHHIRTGRGGEPKGTVWCGAPLDTMRWDYESIDHAAASRIARDRLLPCPACRAAIIAALENEG